jgi:hypothetical protein
MLSSLVGFDDCSRAGADSGVYRGNDVPRQGKVAKKFIRCTNLQYKSGPLEF